MPRLLPRLIEEVQRARATSETKVFHTRLKREPKPRPGALFRPVTASQTFSFRGRKQSILLDTLNPILHRESFLHKKVKKPSIHGTDGGNNTSPAERGFSSNPYLRMLSSPLRKCSLTDKYLPIDFMVRLAMLQVSSDRLSSSYIALLPDGIEHPRYRRRNSGRGYYIMCYKQAVDACIRTPRRKLKRIPSTVKIHSLLAEQIGRQLRNRVLQELELLSERLRCSPQNARESMTVRRLTRSEWEDLRSHGRISQPGAVAVLIVPPVQKSLLMQAQEGMDYSQKATLLPLSELHPSETVSTSTGLQVSPPSLQMIPLYNGVVLFPSPLLRHELYRRLQTILTVERNARWRQDSHSQASIKDENRGQKSSHAYIIFANRDTARRSDGTSLAVALWRLRLWEGQGWDRSKGDYGGWVVNRASLL